MNASSESSRARAQSVQEQVDEVRQEELLYYVRDAIVRLEILADRLEGYVRTSEEAKPDGTK